MAKKKKEKQEVLKKPSNIVLVSSFHSDEEEPWVYTNRASYGHVKDYKGIMAQHNVMRAL